MLRKALRSTPPHGRQAGYCTRQSAMGRKLRQLFLTDEEAEAVRELRDRLRETTPKEDEKL
jgi:hypothetical protein